MRWFESVFQKGVSVGFFRKKAECEYHISMLTASIQESDGELKRRKGVLAQLKKGDK